MTYSTLKTTTLLALICCGSAYASPKFSGPTPSKAPLTAEEYRCGKMVQGRVAWNRAGTTRWQAKNVNNLCAGVTDASARVGCFKEGISQHNSWQQAIADCKLSAKSLEKRCYNKVQGRVAWNTSRATKWSQQNVFKLCDGVSAYGHHAASRRIACFKKQMPRVGWKYAIGLCTKDSLH